MEDYRMSLKQTLLNNAADFCVANGISLSRLSTIVANDGNFFRRLAGKGDCTTALYDKFQSVFHDPLAWAAAQEADRERRISAKRKKQAA
jgi:hypothetical protein